jgi:expansin
MRLACAIAVASCSSGDKPPPPRVEPPPCIAAPDEVTGSATHYALTTAGKCSFEPGEPMIAAAAPADYAGGVLCGACLAVKSGDAEVIVRVVDRCPGCKPGDLDLGSAAFAQLAPLARGRIPVTWRVVPCEIRGPIQYRFKEQSNDSWTAVQIRNHRYPIASVEVRDERGAFRPIARAEYNYFVAPKGLGPGPYALRVTDTRGHAIEDIIAGGDGELRTSVSQFPACR